jgi:DNA-binding NarL/FixJ family response regulator
MTRPDYGSASAGTETAPRVEAGLLSIGGGRSVHDLSPLGRRSAPLQAVISAEVRQSACLAALEQARVRILIVNAESRVLWMSAGAERALTSLGLVVSFGRLQATTQLGTQRLHTAIGETLRDRRSGLVSLPAQKGVAPQLTVAPIRSESFQPGADQLALISLIEPELGIDQERLADSYALTPSEARLLSALVKGERLVDYSTRSGVKVSTAKTHLRSLFEKTGEHRQADLIRRALNDPNLRVRLNEHPPQAMRVAA